MNINDAECRYCESTDLIAEVDPSDPDFGDIEDNDVYFCVECADEAADMGWIIRDIDLDPGAPADLEARA